jgi:hypothetical protein
VEVAGNAVTESYVGDVLARAGEPAVSWSVLRDGRPVESYRRLDPPGGASPNAPSEDRISAESAADRTKAAPRPWVVFSVDQSKFMRDQTLPGRITGIPTYLRPRL